MTARPPAPRPGPLPGEPRARGPIAEILAGAAMLPKGMGVIGTRPKLFALGAIPPAITSVLMIGSIIALAVYAPDIVAALTPFADGWAMAEVFRFLVAVALVFGIVLIMVIAFSTITLAVGSPLYDKISGTVDQAEGDLEQPYEEPVATAAGRAVRQSLALIAVSALVAVLLFVAGFVPVVGQTVVPVVSACFGGWMITTELIGSAFERRGRLTLAERRSAMRRYRLRCLGFGVPCFLLLSLPIVAVFVFPGATAGGALLARSLLAGDDRTANPRTVS